MLRKEIGKKNKINVTRSENCEFVRPWTVYRLGRNYVAPAACCEAVYTASITDLSACQASAESVLPAPPSRNHAKHRERAHLVFLRTISRLRLHSVESRKKIKSRCSVIYFWVLLVRAFQFKFFYTITFGSSVFRMKHVPVAGFLSTYVVILKI